jgi:hypothetical protein
MTTTGRIHHEGLTEGLTRWPIHDLFFASARRFSDHPPLIMWTPIASPSSGIDRVTTSSYANGNLYPGGKASP